MKTNHTPGPWHVVEFPDLSTSIMPDMMRRKNAPPNDPASYGFEIGTGYAVAFVDGWINDLQNARLIAAAPDLLAVAMELEESAAYWSDYDVPIGIVDRIRAAIAKARGE